MTYGLLIPFLTPVSREAGIEPHTCWWLGRLVRLPGSKRAKLTKSPKRPPSAGTLRTKHKTSRPLTHIWYNLYPNTSTIFSTLHRGQQHRSIFNGNLCWTDTNKDNTHRPVVICGSKGMDVMELGAMFHIDFMNGSQS